MKGEKSTQYCTYLTVTGYVGPVSGQFEEKGVSAVLHESSFYSFQTPYIKTLLSLAFTYNLPVYLFHQRALSRETDRKTKEKIKCGFYLIEP